ncbi:MAG: NTP transferase domain-containing protein [Prevotellaceae bacterium]|jgi:NDP-sugar pyrophosphorylase family protein|nr:NTP transferase domain-containing protein [Prevotellaceae bacterium]
MNYAIIAAGEGSRLASEGFDTPKPIVKLNGIPLIKRLISIFEQNGVSSITVIINDMGNEVKEYLRQAEINVPFNLIIKSTPSSMHSFYELMPYLENDKFCLTTVDTIFDENEFSCYIRSFLEDKAIDGLMAVTSFIDDEKPLYVDCNEDNMIRNFEDMNSGNIKYISGGIYCLYPTVFKTLRQAIYEGKSRMRNFQRQLIQDGYKLKAFPFSQIIDVDHIEDIKKAELFLKNKK